MCPVNETTLHCNFDSHQQGAYTKWSLLLGALPWLGSSIAPCVTPPWCSCRSVQPPPVHWGVSLHTQLPLDPPPACHHNYAPSWHTALTSRSKVKSPVSPYTTDWSWQTQTDLFLVPFNNQWWECRTLSFNSLWPSDAIWRQRSGSTLAQVMACCLTAPSHYLNQCWLIISEVQWHSY